MKTTLTITALLALACTAGVAHADRFEVSAGAGNSYAGIENMDSLGEDSSYVTAGMGVGYRLPTHTLLAGFDTVIDMRYQSGSYEGETFGRLESELDIDRFEVGARLHRSLRSYLEVYGRASMGIAWGELQLDDLASSFARPIESDAKAALSTAAVGLDLKPMVSARSKLRIGLRTELGYSALSSFSFDSTPEPGPEGEIRIPTRSAGLGSVNASGAYLRFALVASF